jgi:hypothetical protein
MVLENQDMNFGQNNLTHVQSVPHYQKPKPVLSQGVLSDVTHYGTNKSALKSFM